ncbi:hypothetical protein GIB67_027353 [Kingdonia uniflora]|uniref:ELM2 domain-containing protein n=1 Tax=Kingdonia uniflora TaxID=39325 RepID=A0A7J7MF09_9MAGN|nr:hypothetical protein GIB67_027353 [Kingdonia uniflora]
MTPEVPTKLYKELPSIFSFDNSIGTFNIVNSTKACGPRSAIPVGPRFQADVPDWVGPPCKEQLFDSKWLDFKVWPLKGKKLEASNGQIGKGRPHICLCQTPGSTIFDEMGEVASGLWTHRQQESFNNLVKMTSGLKDKSFLKQAIQYFPCKSRENIVSYYFNVIVLRRMSKLTRLASAAVAADSDDDDEDEDEDEDEEKEGKPRKLLSRYLT